MGLTTYTEKDWLEAKKPEHLEAMLSCYPRLPNRQSWFEFLFQSTTKANARRAKFRDRKMNLCRVAYCKRISEFFPDNRCRVTFQLLEAFADGTVCSERLMPIVANVSPFAGFPKRTKSDALYDRQKHAVNAVFYAVYEALEMPPAQEYYIDARLWAAEVLAPGAIDHSVSPHFHEATPDVECELALQCDVIRDICPNPFRDYSGFGKVLRKAGNVPLLLAVEIHQTASFVKLPVLGYMLSQAGCRYADVLEHCRSEGPHYRGCWVVDLILGHKPTEAG